MMDIDRLILILSSANATDTVLSPQMAERCREAAGELKRLAHNAEAGKRDHERISRYYGEEFIRAEMLAARIPVLEHERDVARAETQIVAKDREDWAQACRAAVLMSAESGAYWAEAYGEAVTNNGVLQRMFDEVNAERHLLGDRISDLENGSALKAMRAERDEARAMAKMHEEHVAEFRRQRDEAHAEIARLERAELASALTAPNRPPPRIRNWFTKRKEAA